MFKSVEYVGFEAHPELRALAERGTAALAGEIGTWRDRVAVRWSPGAPDALEMALALELPNGVAGERTGMFTPDDFARDAATAARARRIWSDLLGDLLDALDARVQEALLEPVGA
jgi:hypothetical protein